MSEERVWGGPEGGAIAHREQNAGTCGAQEAVAADGVDRCRLFLNLFGAWLAAWWHRPHCVETVVGPVLFAAVLLKVIE